MKRSFWARRILFFILLAPLAVFVFGSVVMLLWNNALAPVLHISTITFWQGLGILVLSKILFSSFSGGSRPRRAYWKQRTLRKWNNMSPEEKEKFKEEWKNRCGGWGYEPWQAESGTSPMKTES